MHINQVIAKIIDDEPEEWHISGVSDGRLRLWTIKSEADAKEKAACYGLNAIPRYRNYLHDGNEALRALEWFGANCVHEVIVHHKDAEWWIEGFPNSVAKTLGESTCAAILRFHEKHHPDLLDYTAIEWE